MYSAYRYHIDKLIISHSIHLWNLQFITCFDEGPAWLSGKVVDSQSRGPWFEPHWIVWIPCGSVLGQDTSEPQPSTGETQERHEECELSP